MMQVTERSPLEVLADPATTLSATVRAVEELEAADVDRRTVTLGLASNVTMQLFGLYLRKHALLADARLTVHPGNFDDLLGDVDHYARLNVDIILMHPFFDNL